MDRTPTNNSNARGRRMGWMLGVVAALSMADLALTLGMMHTVGMYETNPLAVAVVRRGSLALVGYKLMSMAVAGGLLWMARGTRAGQAGGLLGVVVMVALGCQWAHVLGSMAMGHEGGTEPEVGGASWVCLAEVH
jgi:hypothetical protein